MSIHGTNPFNKIYSTIRSFEERKADYSIISQGRPWHIKIVIYDFNMAGMSVVIDWGTM